MKTNYLVAAAVITLIGANGSASASTISLQPESTITTVGDIFSLNVVLDFGGDPTFGGGVDISWDETLLEFVDWTFDTSTVQDDPSFREVGELLDGRLTDISAGEIGDGLIDGIMGTITFMAISQGDAIVDIGPASDPLLEWVSLAFVVQTPDYIGAGVAIQPVPVPAALWMLLGGLGTLAGVGSARRRRSRR